MFENLKHVVLCADFHYVNGVAVFHSISRKINYRTVSFPLSRSKGSIINELHKNFKIYNARGFKVIEVHGDSEFEKVETEIIPVRLRMCGTDGHIPEIERSVQTQKNENRTVCQAMPYRSMPRLMIRELVMQGNTFLNAFGNKDLLDDGLSPRNIIDNLPHVDYNDLKYEFGEYVQLHVTEKFTNNMKTRTIGAIVLGPRKIQGQYNYMSLESGEQRDGRVVARLPLTAEVIGRVEQLGTNQGQPLRAAGVLQYEWRPGYALEPDDVHIAGEANDHYIDPPAINQIPVPPVGPNPFALAQPIDHQGAVDIEIAHEFDANDDNAGI